MLLYASYVLLVFMDWFLFSAHPRRHAITTQNHCWQHAQIESAFSVIQSVEILGEFSEVEKGPIVWAYDQLWSSIVVLFVRPIVLPPHSSFLFVVCDFFVIKLLVFLHVYLESDQFRISIQSNMFRLKLIGLRSPHPIHMQLLDWLLDLHTIQSTNEWRISKYLSQRETYV